MAWFEVKKINSNFLKEALDRLIIKKSNELAVNVNEKNENLLAYAEELKGKKAGFFGSLSKIYVFTGKSLPELELDLHVEGRGSVEFYFVVQELIGRAGDASTTVGWRVVRPTEYQVFPGTGGGWGPDIDWEMIELVFTTAIDGVEYGKVRMKDSYEFEQSFSIKGNGFRHFAARGMVEIAVVTLY